MTIRVFRVTLDGHSAHFDDFDVAMSFLKNGLVTRGLRMQGGPDSQATLESLHMNEEEYHQICEVEDAAGTKLT